MISQRAPLHGRRRSHPARTRRSPPRPGLSSSSSSSSSILISSSPWSVEPGLQAVDVVLGCGLDPGARPRRSGTCPLGPPRVRPWSTTIAAEGDDAPRSPLATKSDVDDQHPEPTWNPHAGEVAHQRVEGKRDHRLPSGTGTERGRAAAASEEREQRRAPAARRAEPSGAPGSCGGPPCGHRMPVGPRARARPGERVIAEQCGTVARWPRRAPGKRPVSAPASGAPSNARASSLLLSARRGLALVTLVLTAFGGGSTPSGSQTEPAPRTARCGHGRSRLSATSIELPVPAASVTAIGYHGANDGALALQPVGARRTRGCSPGCGGASPARKDGPVWYQLDGAPGPRCSTSARRREPTSTPGRRHGRRDQRHRDRRAKDRLAHRHPADRGARRRPSRSSTSTRPSLPSGRR